MEKNVGNYEMRRNMQREREREALLLLEDEVENDGDAEGDNILKINNMVGLLRYTTLSRLCNSDQSTQDTYRFHVLWVNTLPFLQFFLFVFFFIIFSKINQGLKVWKK